jgi:hypothetical protein
MFCGREDIRREERVSGGEDRKVVSIYLSLSSSSCFGANLKAPVNSDIYSTFENLES